MTLSRLEVLELEAQDGILRDADLAELEAAGIVADWPRDLVLEALLDGMPTGMALADGIMGAIDEDPELVAVGALVREAVLAEAGEAPSLSGRVLEAIEQDPEWLATSTLLQEAVRAEAGEVHLADAVLAAIEAEASGNVIPLHPAFRAQAVRHAQEAVAARHRPWAERYLPTIAGLAAAAALLLVFWTPVQGGGDADLAFDLSPYNHVQIEDISSDSDAMVQVLAFDEDSPPIIFIEEADDSRDEGAPL